MAKLNKTGKRRTICEVHREMHDIIYDDIENDKVKTILITKLTEAFTMAKRMDRKLREYSKKWDDGWWEDTPNFYKTLKKRTRRANETNTSK